jgi:hypothetical protein
MKEGVNALEGVNECRVSKAELKSPPCFYGEGVGFSLVRFVNGRG